MAGSVRLDAKRSAASWVRFTPYFLSGVLFLSLIFLVFAPIPLLLLAFKRSKLELWMALLVNACLVTLGGGMVSAVTYLVLVGSVSVFLPYFLQNRRLGVEKTVAMTFLSMLVLTATAGLVYSWVLHLSPLRIVEDQVSTVVGYMQEMSLNQGADWEVPPEELRRSILLDFPSALGILYLVMIWANLTLLVRSSQTYFREVLGLDPEFFKNWKAPEFLIWPTIVAGATIVFGHGLLTAVGVNVFKFLMAIYAIQGLSVLAFFFDAWGIRGLIRTLAYLFVVFLMLPLLLGLGFFDLWFDFRKKFRQA